MPAGCTAWRSSEIPRYHTRSRCLAETRRPIRDAIAQPRRHQSRTRPPAKCRSLLIRCSLSGQRKARAGPRPAQWGGRGDRHPGGDMRCVSVALFAVLMSVAPVSAAMPRGTEPVSAEAVQKWMYGYRARPDIAQVPAAFRALSRLGALKDPDSSGVYVGFLAGVIATNPTRAEDL